jgi:DNA helicase-2/ATP-dependent DNA helicase PcrA
LKSHYSVKEVAALSLPDIKLTDEQEAVIGAPFESRLVVAGAGSGKTTVMALRVIYLIANQVVQPQQILGLTFTRKATAELRSRIRRALGGLGTNAAGGIVQLPTVATYNSYAANIVRNYGLRLGIDPDSRVLTAAQSWQLAHEVVEAWDGQLPAEWCQVVNRDWQGKYRQQWEARRAEEELNISAAMLARRVLVMAEQFAQHSLSPAEFLRVVERFISAIDLTEKAVNPDSGKELEAKPKAARSAVESLFKRRVAAYLAVRYAEVKRQRGLMDFFDQDAWAAKLVVQDSQVADAERDQFKAVLLDEFQDTSSLQLELLASIFCDTPTMAVGDPNQAIYGWRSASAEALDQFRQRFQVKTAGGARSPAPELSLSVARRNARLILQVANRLVEPLRGQATLADDCRRSALVPRPDAGNGEVESGFFVDELAQAQAIASYLADRWAAANDGGAARTAAIVVRKADQIPPISAALTRAHLQFQIIGRGGLLGRPEVQDIVSLLRASCDPSRGDALMRLATAPRFAIGIRDLRALNSMLVKPERSIAPDSAEQVFALDAVEALTSGTNKRPAAMSVTGARRIKQLGLMLQRIRQASRYLQLAQLVLEAERTLRLDVDMTVRYGPQGRAQINRLVSEAHQYSRGQEQPSLAAFLDWLEDEAEIGQGLALAEQAPTHSAIQIMTIHSAKGLEWDVVVVPGLHEGGLPGIKPNRMGEFEASGWMSDASTPGAAGGLPWELRRDKAHLPAFELADRSNVLTLAEALSDFRQMAGAHFVNEDRRVAYVAVTRAKTHLLMTGYWRRSDAAKPFHPPSLFLRELAQAGLVQTDHWASPDQRNPQELITAAGRSQEPAEVQAPIWPMANPLGDRAALVKAAAALVKQQQRELGSIDLDQAQELLRQSPSKLLQRTSALLREQQSAQTPVVELADQLSATQLSLILADPQGAAVELRRPIPSRPNAGSSIGHRFHALAAVELAARSRGSGVQGLLGEHDFGMLKEDAKVEAIVERLMARLRESVWFTARFTPIAIESAIEFEHLGRVICARIDAVFAEDGDRTVVVDWKTGRSDNGKAHAAHVNQVQLYLNALAGLNGAGPAQAAGYVHYVSENLSVPVLAGNLGPGLLAALQEVA